MRLSPVLLLLLCAGCTRIPTTWESGRDAIVVTATGQPGAALVVLAGPPTGPHFIPGAGEVWSTVGPEGMGGALLARAPFDAAGVARATIATDKLPRVKTLLQAIALSEDGPVRPLGVSSCMALRWEDGVPVLRPHVADALASPVGPRLLAAAAVVLAWWLARRTTIVAGPARGAGIALVVLWAAFLLGLRVVEPQTTLVQARRDQPTPLFPPSNDPATRATTDPLDRVTRAGFRDLVRSVAEKVDRATPLRIVAPNPSGMEQYRAAQAAWLVWPWKAEVLLGPPATPEAGVVYLTVDGGPDASGGEILFRNDAGTLWRARSAESR